MIILILRTIKLITRILFQKKSGHERPPLVKYIV